MTVRWSAALGAAVLSVVGLQGITPQGGRPSPLSLVLLLDVSASVDLRTLELPRDISREIETGLLARLTTADRFGVGAFGNTLKFSGFLPDDSRTRAAGVRAAFKDRSVGLNGPSRIWDAVDDVISALEKESGRRAVIVLTDGYASGNRLGVADVIRRAQTTGVAVAVIANGGWVVPSRILVPLATPRTALERLTAGTGGLLVLDDVGDSFRPRHPGHFFEAILARLRAGGPA